MAKRIHAYLESFIFMCLSGHDEASFRTRSILEPNEGEAAKPELKFRGRV